MPDDLEVDNIVANGTANSFTVKDGDLYYYYKAWNMKYTVPINKIDGVSFEANKYISRGSGWPNPYVIYDNDNKRFVKANNGSCSIITDSSGNLFGILQVAQGTFFVGDRRLVLADVDTFGDVLG